MAADFERLEIILTLVFRVGGWTALERQKAGHLSVDPPKPRIKFESSS